MQMRMRHKSPHFWFAAGSRSNLAKTIAGCKSNLPRKRKCCVWHIIFPVVHSFHNPGCYLRGGSCGRKEGASDFVVAAVDSGTETRVRRSAI